MTDFNPEGTRDHSPASSATPEPTPKPITGFTFPPGQQFPSLYGYGIKQGSGLMDETLQPRLIPNIFHTLLFFFIAVVMLVLTEIGATVLYQLFMHGPQSSSGLNRALVVIASNPVYSIPAQAASYGLLVLISIPVFESIWMRPFGETLHWRGRRALRLFWPMLGLGLLAGVVIGFFGNFLPMPKSPPILRDMTTSTTAAWFMFVFGTTVAPMTEELAFRGFLLPSCINLFRLAERKGFSTETITRYLGIPLSIILTTIPFTLLHASQVADAWGPLLLIATVSVILCIVRLATDSVAAGAVVHGAYNFVLFAGVIYQTSGFQHLHKLVR